MGAFENYLLGRRLATARPPPQATSLTLPDLDAPPPPPPEPAPEPPPEPEGPTKEELLDEARMAGHRDGMREGEARGRARARDADEARIAGLLERLAESLARSEAEALDLAGKHAAAIATTLLATLDAALPAAAARLGPELIIRTATTLRPALEEHPEARLLVHPEMVGLVSARLPHWTIEPDEAIAPGDARIAWRGGAAILDLAARRRAIRATLASLDLIDPEESP